MIPLIISKTIIKYYREWLATSPMVMFDNFIAAINIKDTSKLG